MSVIESGNTAMKNGEALNGQVQNGDGDAIQNGDGDAVQNGDGDAVQNGDAIQNANTSVQSSNSSDGDPTPQNDEHEEKRNGDNSPAENGASNGDSSAAIEGDKKSTVESNGEPSKKKEMPAELSKLESLVSKLSEDSPEVHKSILKKHLTKAVLDKLKDRKTAYGGTLEDCIRSGCENPSYAVGLNATDPDAYKTFADLFDPIIKEAHQLPAKKNLSQPTYCLGGVEFEQYDPECKIVLASKISLRRSLDGYGFQSILTPKERKEIESKVVDALKAMDQDDTKGTYHSLEEMDAEKRAVLEKDGFLFQDDDGILRSAGCYGDWPKNRGVFCTQKKNLVVWVNQEDHLKITSIADGSHLHCAYRMLLMTMNSLDSKLNFARDSRLGFLTFNPANLGTTIKASVRIRVPLLAKYGDLNEFCEPYHLQVTEIPPKSPGCEYTHEITNTRVMGLSEHQLITDFHRGLKQIVRLEEKMAWCPNTIDEMYELLRSSSLYKSLAKKHLTLEMFESLKDKKTSKDGTLRDCLLYGLLDEDCPIGLRASDKEAFSEFAPLFDAVIKDQNMLKAEEAITHPEQDFGDLDNLELGNLDLEPEKLTVLSTCVKVVRNLRDFGFLPVLTSKDRLEIEKQTKYTLDSLEGELKGVYTSFEDLTEEAKKDLEEELKMFSPKNRFMAVAGFYKDWPQGRGIFCTESKKLQVWLNEDNHIQIISFQKMGDMDAVYKALVAGVKALQEKLSFSQDDRLGYLTYDPSHLGTGLQVIIRMEIPHIASQKDFKTILEKFKLQAKRCKNTEIGVYQISNKFCLGLTEIEIVRQVSAAVKELIELEKIAAAKAKSCHVL